jgi:hypothetical protein
MASGHPCIGCKRKCESLGKNAKTPQILKIFPDLAKEDIKIRLLGMLCLFLALYHFNYCMDWLFKIREIRVIRGVFGVLVTRTYNCTLLRPALTSALLADRIP